MDGTLAHTREAHGDVWAEWAAGKGIAISREQYLTEIYGRSNFDILPKVLPQFAGDRDAIRALTAEKEDLFRRMLIAGQVPAVAGAAAFIRAGARAGFPMAVASAAPRENVDLALAMLGVQDLISVRVGEEDVERTKPEPDAYLLAAERLGLPAEDCVVFEDSRFGLLAGRGAGCRTVAILSQHTAEELGDLADLAVLDFEELRALPPWSQIL